MTVRRLAVAVLVAVLAGCSGPSSPDRTAHPGTAGSRVTAADNIAAAGHEATRLMSLVRLPAGAELLKSAPPHMDGPVTGVPAATSVVDDARFWSVPMSFPDAVGWIESHPPRGALTSNGQASGGGPGYRAFGLGYLAKPSEAWREASLQVGVGTGGAKRSYLRVDAVVLWLDPRPVHDNLAGPRIHFTVADGCPGIGTADAGVSNSRPGLDRALLPQESPTGALLCKYGGMGIDPTHLVGHRLLNAGAAQRAASIVNALPLSHPDGLVFHCPAAFGTAGYAAFTYPSGSAVDIRVDLSGCEFVRNGVIAASAGRVPDLFARIATSS